MNEEIQKSIMEVAQAIENLNRAFEKRAEDLRQAGDASEFEKWVKATHAMRDSGNIYLAWAKHYARSAGSEAAASESELADFLDEESV